MAYNLPGLPYEDNALEPVISQRTIEFHYGKHHRAYVDNLNKLIPGTAFENATLEEIIKKAEGGLFNNGAQVWNHTFYWSCFKPGGGGEPDGNLAAAIVKYFGSFDEFKKIFTTAAVTLFGSGWAWLVKDDNGSLQIIQEGNAGNPLRNGLTPLLTFDVWEHAYYLDKQNRRPDYISDLWRIIDWKAIAARY